MRHQRSSALDDDDDDDAVAIVCRWVRQTCGLCDNVGLSVATQHDNSASCNAVIPMKCLAMSTAFVTIEMTHLRHDLHVAL